MAKPKTAHLHGVVAATLTPLDRNPTPDTELLVHHCRWLLENGCDGINLMGTTGEATSLGIAQRLAVMESVAESGLPLSRFMVGTGVSALADPTLALYLYHYPALSGVSFTPALIARLTAAYPASIAGVKDSSGDLTYSDALVQRFPQLDIFPSSEAVLLEARQRGYAGCISATANITAPLAGRAWAAGGVAAGDGATAQAAASELRTMIARYPLVAAIRHAARDVFDDARWARILPPLTRAQASELDVALQAHPAYGQVVAAARHTSGE
jgi:4-hydroxy-tetrahydrodipicolinate synthase